MANLRLDTLPQELMARIATSSNAYSILQLAATCHKIRAACYDALLFKEVIQQSQATYWREECLDVAAIERRCGKDVSAWAHYALADELTMRYKEEMETVPFPTALKAFAEAPKPSSISWSTWTAQARISGETGLIMTWLPELFVVQHPSMLDDFWDEFVDKQPTVINARHIFCLAISALATGALTEKVGTMLYLERKLTLPYHQQKLVNGSTMSDFLWVLTWTIVQIRNGVKNRLSIWPFDDAARVPHISTASISTMHFQPLNHDYKIPLPLSNTFDEWYGTHTSAMATEKYMTAGVWQGYYTYYGHFHLAASARQFDPPMKNVRFTRDFQHSLESLRGSASHKLRLIAEHCYDGIDKFTVKGTVTKKDGDTVFQGTKRYANGRTYWDWDLRMTPLGLVGFWGRAREQSFRRKGSMWLWKVEE